MQQIDRLGVYLHIRMIVDDVKSIKGVVRAYSKTEAERPESQLQPFEMEANFGTQKKA